MRAFHAAHPGVTSAVMAAGQSAAGGSSYEVLAARAAGCDAVMDLGCGDGYLLERVSALSGVRRMVGIDMSLAELLAARNRPALAAVSLVAARGDALPLAPDSVDCVLSHLAFMLMSRIDRAADEIGRVLRSGGRFAAVVGGGPTDTGDAFDVFLALFRDVYAASERKAPRLGDKRARHGDGFAELFDDGFDAPTETLLTIRLDDSADTVWQLLAASYELFVLDAGAIAGLRDRFLAAAAQLADAAGDVPCAMRMRLIEVVRR